MAQAKLLAFAILPRTDFLPPSPPAEQATPSQHQRGQSCTDAAQLRDTAKYQPDRKRGGLGQKENPAEAGQGLILEGNQDEDTATTLIAAVLEA